MTINSRGDRLSSYVERKLKSNTKMVYLLIYVSPVYLRRNFCDMLKIITYLSLKGHSHAIWDKKFRFDIRVDY